MKRMNAGHYRPDPYGLVSGSAVLVLVACTPHTNIREKVMRRGWYPRTVRRGERVPVIVCACTQWFSFDARAVTTPPLRQNAQATQTNSTLPSYPLMS